MHAWLLLDDNHVAIVHCVNGLAKSSTAICSYLIFSQIVTNARDALDYFNYRKGLPYGTCPSLGQRRYLEYFDAIYSFGGKLNNPYPVQLFNYRFTYAKSPLIILPSIPNLCPMQSTAQLELKSTKILGWYCQLSPKEWNLMMQYQLK